MNLRRRTADQLATGSRATPYVSVLCEKSSLGRPELLIREHTRCVECAELLELPCEAFGTWGDLRRHHLYVDLLGFADA